jgi:hypothetical protein
MLACDLFHIDCAVTLRRMYVFFLVEVGTPSCPCPRRNLAPGRRLDGRNLLMGLGSVLTLASSGFLVRDRVGQFTDGFDAVLSAAGIEVLKTRRTARGRTLMPKGGAHGAGRGHRPDAHRPVARSWTSTSLFTTSIAAPGPEYATAGQR